VATTLYFVQSDTLPEIKFTLLDETTNTVKNLANKEVHLHAKPATGTGVSFTRKAIIETPSTGIAIIRWQTGDLLRPAGNYTAELEIIDTLTGSRETVYETITLVIREDIGDAVGSPAPSLPEPSTNPPPGNVNP